MAELVAEQKVKRDAFSSRIHEIDFLRGLCMFLVFMDHLFWDFSYYFANWARYLGDHSSLMYHLGQWGQYYWQMPARYFIRIAVLCIFVFVSGVSTAFSKNNWKRAGLMLALGFIICIGSNVLNAWFGTGSVINFNVIFVIGWSVLFYCFIQDKKWKSLLIMTGVLLAISISLPFLQRLVLQNNQTGFGSMVLPFWDIDGMPYRYFNSDLSFSYSAINGKTYFSADYMPLFPYIVVFFLGAMFARCFYTERTSLLKRHEFERPVCFVGRHSLIFYITHQFVFLGIFNLIAIIGGLPQ